MIKTEHSQHTHSTHPIITRHDLNLNSTYTGHIRTLYLKPSSPCLITLTDLSFSSFRCSSKNSSMPKGSSSFFSSKIEGLLDLSKNDVSTAHTQNRHCTHNLFCTKQHKLQSTHCDRAYTFDSITYLSCGSSAGESERSEALPREGLGDLSTN